MKKIPSFDNVKDEARFWDTHDIGDFMGELKIIEGSYSPVDENKTTMTIRVSPSLKNKVEKIARSYDVPTSSLVRMWMVDRLRSLVS